jgi:hypothetical protein
MSYKSLFVFFFLLAGLNSFGQRNEAAVAPSIYLNNKMFRGSAFVPYLKLNYVKAMIKGSQRTFFDGGNGLNLGFIGSFDSPHSRFNLNFEAYGQYLQINDKLIDNVGSARFNANVDIKLANKQKRIYPLLRLGGEVGTTAYANGRFEGQYLSEDMHVAGIIGLGVHVFPRSTKMLYNSDLGSRLEYKFLLLYNKYSRGVENAFFIRDVFALQLVVKNVFTDRYTNSTN